MSWFISDLKRIICDCILICPRNQKPFSTLCCWIFITNIQVKITLFSFIVSFLCLSFHWTSLFNGHFNDSRYLVTVSFPYTEIHFGLYIFVYKSRMDHSFDIHLERVQKLCRVSWPALTTLSCRGRTCHSSSPYFFSAPTNINIPQTIHIIHCIELR